ETQSHYGQVVQFIALRLPPARRPVQTNSSHPRQPTTLILALVAPIKPESFNEFGTPSYTKLGPIEVVDASTIQCVVGRVYDRNRWTIIERDTMIRVFDTVVA
ncbi:hypothetical protein BD779DRAFT_1450131, partial [Infundibulicybe gibba]